ncbi:Tat proofreading chaperone DmsD, partial [Xanthomonas citri pv. citri]|nr:Tat proofreading chaperone DmsD [Xanthomonas citri pv. citri]
MQNELQQWISISGRLLGSLFYYEPNNENVQSALHFFQQE